jgi:hypothetical protein
MLYEGSSFVAVLVKSVMEKLELNVEDWFQGLYRWTGTYFYFHFYDFSRLQILIFASLARYMLKLEEHRIKTAVRKEA